MNERSLRLLLTVPFFAVACGGSSVDLSTAAATGAPVSAELSQGPDGALHADVLRVAARGGDDDDIECEDGVTPEGAPCEDDDDEEHEDEDEDDDDGDFYDPHDDDDGEEADDDEEDDDEEEEDDDDDHGGGTACSSSTGAASFLKGKVELGADGKTPHLFGVILGDATVADGDHVLASGAYDTGCMAVSQLTAVDAGMALGGLSEGISKTGARTWSLQVLGQTVIVDRDTRIVESALPVADGEVADD
ncbi:MAG: hypothetical protein H6742_04905 [Alphaproteobacteria bacterium]|nr:hypothetical protein [Alphaproteobacteria bacterium]